MSGVEKVALAKGDARGGAVKLEPGQWGRDDHGLVYVRCAHLAHTDDRPRVGVIHRGAPHADNWSIDAAGRVTPSIWFKESACDWHVFATLEGWTP